MPRALSIAIDGPAGAGKSTVSKMLAAVTGYALLDTGAMYRAFAWAFMHDRSKDPEADIEETVLLHSISVSYSQNRTSVTCDGTDITDEIRSAPVTALVSEVSANAVVRSRAVELQRALVETELAAHRGVILEGRDIGTTVLPNASLKFFLTASDATRASRRALEIGGDEQQIRQLMAARDLADMNREISPLRKAADAIEIDATHLTPEQVVTLMLKKIDDVA